MHNLIIASLILISTSWARAALIQFQLLDLRSESDLGPNQVLVQQTPEGKIKINFQSQERTVEGHVVADNRPADGNLEIDLGQGQHLIATAGFSPTGLIQYFFRVNGHDIELKPNVYLNLQGKQ